MFRHWSFLKWLPKALYVLQTQLKYGTKQTGSGPALMADACSLSLRAWWVSCKAEILVSLASAIRPMGGQH
jgi:hypothetical protein